MKQGPPPDYDNANRDHDNPGFIQDQYATQYNPSSGPGPYATDYSGDSKPNGTDYPPQYGQPPYPQHGQQPAPITTDPYANNYGPTAPNQYGNVGYSQYATSGQTITINQPTESARVPDHFGLALFVTICCCWPLGLMAITKNSEAKRQAAEGNIAAAHESAESSKKTSIIGIISGIILLGIAIGIGVWYYLRLRDHSYYYYY